MTPTPETAELVRAGGRHVPELLEQVEGLLRESAAGHGEQLARHAGQTIAAGGKRLRPLIVLLAGGAPRDENSADALVRAGAAVELVHSATLVHDDVLDGATLRRGNPTVVAVAGREMATAAGDLLFSRAFALLTTREGSQPGPDAAAVRLLSDACSALARGELLQRADAWNAAVTRDRYLLRCELKTARLFQAGCELGELAAGERRLGLGEFGRRIGLAFQLLDDVLDVSGPAARTGKQRGADLLDGTVTLPFILARERDPALADIEPRSVKTPELAESICERIASSGALEDVRALALDHVSGAKADLPAALDGRRRAALELVADSVVERYS